jgi:hypothetical protein
MWKANRKSVPLLGCAFPISDELPAFGPACVGSGEPRWPLACHRKRGRDGGVLAEVFALGVAVHNQRFEHVERGELTWFQEAEETDELMAAVDEGIQAAQEGRVFTLEETKTQMRSWITMLPD